MHELGIVFHIIKQVKEVAILNKATKINSVTLDIGEVSLVIPTYLKDCWKWAISKDEMMKNCKLKIETIKAYSYCEDCETTFETIKYGKICPNCGKNNTYLKIGNEVEIKEIAVE